MAMATVDPSAATTIPDESGAHRVAPGDYEGQVRRTLIELGASDPDILLRNTGDFWHRCRAAGIDAKVTAATIYGAERHRHEVGRTIVQEAREAPTHRNEEWEVIVRRNRASMDRIVQTAGRKASEVRGTEVIFGEFFDDEKALAFARKMTAAGFITTLGPRRALAAEKKKATAAEAVAVIHEPVTVLHEQEGAIPWVKLDRDPKLHEQGMALAAKYGAITTVAKVYEVVGDEINKEDQEIFLVLPLNLRAELKTPPYEAARGQRSKQVVGVDDVMRVVRATVDANLAAGGEGFIVVHNHPSGDPTPSDADFDLTEEIRKATLPYGNGVKLLDHVVIGTRCAVSIHEWNLAKKKRRKGKVHRF